MNIYSGIPLRTGKAQRVIFIKTSLFERKNLERKKMANLLQLKYSEISAIINEMNSEQQKIMEAYNKTKSMVEGTAGDEWQGDAAERFRQDMNELLLVKLRRVADVLVRMPDVAGKLSNNIQQADLSTKTFFSKIE